MKKSNLSIKVIYWITQIAFWFTNVIGVFAVILAFIFIFDILETPQLNVSIPVSVDVLEKGSLELSNLKVYTQFVEMTGKIHFINTPPLLGKIYGVFMLLIFAVLYFMIFTFRKFIINVYKGRYFDLKNIFLLKRIAYTLAGVWLLTVFYSYFQYYFIVKNLTFQSIEFTGNVETYPSVLLVSLFIWVLSHIFMKGVQLQEENNYTI